MLFFFLRSSSLSIIHSTFLKTRDVSFFIISTIHSSQSKSESIEDNVKLRTIVDSFIVDQFLEMKAAVSHYFFFIR